MAALLRQNVRRPLAADQHLAGLRRIEPCYQPQDRRLSRARPAAQYHMLAGMHGKGKTRQHRLFRLITESHIAEFNAGNICN